MNISSKILALCFFQANVWGTVAFSLKAPKASSVALRSSSIEEMFPVDLTFETIQGGNTVRTYELPPWAERVQYVIKSNGRPLKAVVGLWFGPQRQTHTMDMDLQDGDKTPFQATLKFRLGPPVLKVTTGPSFAFPIEIAVSVPSAERSAELGANTEELWDMSDKVAVQGGSVDDGGGGGAVRTFPVAADVESVQVLFWSKDTGKKSLRATIEVLQGPNNKKQIYNLQLGGGSQPFHAVFQTPGSATQLRIINKKYLEDGLFQVAVVPYKYAEKSAFAMGDSNKKWFE
jgi:hypothetical protein